jgi:hypothetical protein
MKSEGTVPLPGDSTASRKYRGMSQRWPGVPPLSLFVNIIEANSTQFGCQFNTKIAQPESIKFVYHRSGVNSIAKHTKNEPNEILPSSSAECDDGEFLFSEPYPNTRMVGKEVIPLHSDENLSQSTSATLHCKIDNVGE